MSNFNTKKEFSFRDLLYKALIFIGTVGIIVYFLPRDGKFNYQFDIDKPWKYGQLMATFDFPIYKDDEVVKHEQDSILASFPAVFPVGQKHVEKSVLSQIESGLSNSPARHCFPPPTTSAIWRKGNYPKYIKQVYFLPKNCSQLHKDSTAVIMVINDKLANQQDINKLYSVKDAYAYMLTADTAHYLRTFYGNVRSTNICSLI